MMLPDIAFVLHKHLNAVVKCENRDADQYEKQN